MDPEAPVAFTVRLPPDEHAQLSALAQAGHRHLNAQVRMMLLEAMSDRVGTNSPERLIDDEAA